MREYIKTPKTLNGPASQTLPCFTLSDGLVLGFLTQMGHHYSTPYPPSGTYVRERGSTVHRCHNLCGARPIKGWVDSFSNQQITFFQAALCSWTPLAAGSHSCQDKTQRCSLPVESMGVAPPALVAINQR